MSNDPNSAMQWFSVVALISIFPLTAFTYRCSRLPKKTKEYNQMLKKLGYKNPTGPAYVPSLESEYSWWDYILPVLFVCAITFLCAYTMILGPQKMGYGDFFSDTYSSKVDQVAGNKKPAISLLLNGPSLAKLKDVKDNDRNMLFAMLVVSLAFAGSYVWAIQSLYRRLSTVDLVPGAYYSIGIRIIFSVFVGLLIYYFLSGGDVRVIVNDNWKVNSPTAIAIYSFLAGMFPQKGLKWLQDKFSLVVDKESSKESSPLPLSMIEGVGLFERTRFVEMGIDNAQNLAKSNFIEVVIRTPFNPREVIDWIGQARLYLYFGDEIILLRKAGIRTIFNLKKVGSEKGGLQRVEKLLEKKISIEKLKTVYTIIQDDQDVIELSRAVEVLIGCDAVDSGIPINRGKNRYRIHRLDRGYEPEQMPLKRSCLYRLLR